MAAIDDFSHNLVYVRNLLSLARALDEATTEAVDVGDIQRAAIVMAVSALDHYVHQRTREGMHEALTGVRPRTDAFHRFPVAMQLTLHARANPGDDAWLDDAIRVQHGHRPFLKVDDIADALRLVSPAALWNATASQLGEATADVKSQVKAIVDRRNKIAHEADIDPTFPTTRWPVSDQLAADAVDYVERVVCAIDVVTS